MTIESTPNVKPVRWATVGVLAVLLIGVTVIVIAGLASEGERPGRDGVLEIEVEDFALRPDRLIVPAEESVTLVFQNPTAYTHNLSFGRSEIVEQGRTTGFREDLFALAEVSTTPRGALIRPTAEVPTATLNIKPGTTVRVQLTLPDEAIGTWQVGCYIGPGCDYRIGPTAELIVE